MPLDRTHQHNSADIMQADDVHTPISPAGGSGVIPSTLPRASYDGDAVTVADGAEGELTWDNLGEGVELLDRTDPAAPVVLVGGVYAVTATVKIDDGMSPTGAVLAGLHLDSDNEDGFAAWRLVPFAFAGQSGAQGTASCTYYIPEGGQIVVTAYNQDGTSALDVFLAEVIVQAIVLDPA